MAIRAGLGGRRRAPLRRAWGPGEVSSFLVLVTSQRAQAFLPPICLPPSPASPSLSIDVLLGAALRALDGRLTSPVDTLAGAPWIKEMPPHAICRLAAHTPKPTGLLEQLTAASPPMLGPSAGSWFASPVPEPPRWHVRSPTPAFRPSKDPAGSELALLLT